MLLPSGRTRRLAFICLQIAFSFTTFAQNKPATVKEYQKYFTTYPFSDPNPVPASTSLYPYYRFDGFTDQPVQRSWKVVELENDYIRVLILPEIGGKIWTAIEKSTGRSFIYYNHSVKFRDIAMRGPWTSGGLEPNFGIIGHTPNCATPVDYIMRSNADGSVSCIIGVLDLLTRTNWRLEINLPADKAYFTTQCFWYNSTPLEQPYYHWMNGGFKASGNLEFVYPGNRYIGHEGEYADWPINKSNGKNLSFYNQNNFGGYKSYHVLGKYTDFFGGYWHDDDFGMVRYAPNDDKAGKKIWIWGLSGQGMIWEKLLTDTDGQYVEMQSGRLFNQGTEKSTYTPFKHRSFSPYASDTWKEYWYPVLRTKGFVYANEYGALNAENENGWLKIYFSPVQKIDDDLEVEREGKVIYSKHLDLQTLKTFVDSIKSNANSGYLTIQLGKNKMVYESDPQADVLNRPVESPKDFDWNNEYGLYLQGREYMDEKMYGKADQKLSAALKLNANFLPAVVKLAELKYRNMLYDQALQLARRALSIDAQDGASNYFYGLINLQVGSIADARDGFAVAALSPDYRDAAYTELARLNLKEKYFEKTNYYADKAIDVNRYNIDALQLLAVSLRYKDSLTEENEVLNEISALDPLNHFVRFEKYLRYPTGENEKGFQSLIRNEMPQQTYLELAVWYYDASCNEEAKRVLQLAPQTVEITYWLNFLQNKNVSYTNMQPDLTFPFRSETAFVLEQLLKKQNDWLLKYHLSLIYRDRNRIEESLKLLNECGEQPKFAPFYANRVELNKEQNDSPVEKDLKKAIALDHEQWRYHKLLANYYISHHEYSNALAITEAFYKTHPANYIMGMLYAKTLMLNKMYKKGDEVLTRIRIIPFEGATDGRELYREAKLMQSVAFMQEKNYKKAMLFINQAREWPENLGVGKPYDDEIDTRLEDWMNYLCLRANKRNNNGDTLLERIIQFKPRVENTVPNFISANALITAWAFKSLNRKSEASEWLEKQVVDYPDDKRIAWSKSSYEKNKLNDSSKIDKDANMRIIESLMQAGLISQ